MFEDTIVALSTAAGEAAIAIIRLSGNESINIVNSLFKGKDLNSVDSHTMNYGYIINPNNNVKIDEVVVAVYKAPKSYTTENMIEINCHGGYYAISSIIDLLLSHGARMAEPGEFTKRAFINGRLDLLQAESVMDIISAKTKISHQLAQKGLDGRISSMIRKLKNDILEVVAQIEVNIDYPEYDDVEEMTKNLLLPKLQKIQDNLEKILENAQTGKIIRDGIPTAIIGRPNVGKSSILNLLLREERAIVTNIEGTTRDTIEGYINIKGVALKLVDTAGIRDTLDIVEKIGVDKALKVIDEAQLIILVLDNSNALNEVDKYLLDITNNKDRIVVVNKIDIKTPYQYNDIKNIIYLSTETKVGLDELESKIAEYAGISNYSSDSLLLSNIRHINKIKEALNNISEAKKSLNINLPVDLAEIDIKNAWYNLGEILGDEAKEDLLDELFSRFCLGK